MQIWNWLSDKSNDTIEGWNLITGFPAHTIPRNYCGVSSSAFSGGFEPAELPGRKERPIFCPLSWKTKFCASLLVFHHCASILSLAANVDVVARISHSLLYHALWGKKERINKYYIAMAFITTACALGVITVYVVYTSVHSAPTFWSEAYQPIPMAFYLPYRFWAIFGDFWVCEPRFHSEISDFQNLSVFSRLLAWITLYAIYIQGVFFNWSARFSVPKWKNLPSQRGAFLHWNFLKS